MGGGGGGGKYRNVWAWSVGVGRGRASSASTRLWSRPTRRLIQHAVEHETTSATPKAGTTTGRMSDHIAL